MLMFSLLQVSENRCCEGLCFPKAAGTEAKKDKQKKDVRAFQRLTHLFSRQLLSHVHFPLLYFVPHGFLYPHTCDIIIKQAGAYNNQHPHPVPSVKTSTFTIVVVGSFLQLTEISCLHETEGVYAGWTKW